MSPWAAFLAGPGPDLCCGEVSRVSDLKAIVLCEIETGLGV